MLFVMFLVATVIQKKKNDEGNIKKKAEYTITAEWNKGRDPNIDCDVDLWVRNPEGQIVFWRSKENAMMNIERDDIGMRNDYFVNANGETILNDEDAEYWYLRAIIPGEYTVNVHLYSCKNKDGYSSVAGDPIPLVAVDVRLTKLNPRAELIETRNVTFDGLWQQKTAFQFTLDSSGNVTGTTQIPTSLFGPADSNLSSGLPIQ